jgi:hypothetical protein
VTTAPELAAALNVDPKTLRQFLRDRFSSKAPGKGKPWTITLPMVVAAARRFPAT